MLTRSTVRSIRLAPVTNFPFPIYSGLCPLSVSVCLLWFVLPCSLRSLLFYPRSVSRIPRRGVVDPLDSVSGLGARGGTPVHLFLPVIRPVGVGAGSQFFSRPFCSVFGCSHPKFTNKLHSSVFAQHLSPQFFTQLPP